ncbi:MAG TPA: Crp/Fnr family transcriptional regulator [Bacteroidales bacterium]
MKQSESANSKINQLSFDVKEIEELRSFMNDLTGLTSHAWPELETLFVLRSYSKNEYFIRQGDHPVYSGFILDGVLREFYTDKDGREYNKAFCFKRSLTGSYYDLSSGNPSTITIQAMTNCKMLIAPYSKIKELINSEVRWLKAAYAWSHHLLMNKFEKEHQLLTLSARERYLLLQQQHPELEQLISGHHLASYLGITSISFSRIRAQIKNEFIIK